MPAPGRQWRERWRRKAVHTDEHQLGRCPGQTLIATGNAEVAWRRASSRFPASHPCLPATPTTHFTTNSGREQVGDEAAKRSASTKRWRETAQTHNKYIQARRCLSPSLSHYTSSQHSCLVHCTAAELSPAASSRLQIFTTEIHSIIRSALPACLR